ncbi:Mis12-Mtw1 protein family-domain-containing protein [Mycena galericulata]|nr:Mis12-Mtw1 protein family-domain-containing protein [Mycena galericulata]
MEAKRQPNPLLAVAAKKSKRDHSTNQASPEETPLGLEIIRAPSSQPTAGPSNPPAKKFKADTSRGLSAPPQGGRNMSMDPLVERDVRDMEDEADRLHRASRAKTTLVPSLAGIAFRTSPKKQLQPRRANPEKQSVAVDTQEPVRDGTPQGARNKILRGDTIAHDANRVRTPDPDPKAHRRRSSLGGRGHRISSSFREGAFTLPHPRVKEESFYKHVDRDVPPSEQVRQMLVWSVSRATGAPSSDLPPEDSATVRAVQQDMMRRLAEGRIDLSLSEREDQDMDDGVNGKNAQNEKNMHWEQVYSNEIQDAEAESQEWKRTQFHWEEYVDKQKKRIDETRRARADKGKPPNERFLDERFRRGLQLARAPPNPAAETLTALPDLQPTLDALHTDLHAARTAVRVAGRVLDARFGLLGAGLDARAGMGVGEGPADARGLLRALATVDAARAGEGERRVEHTTESWDTAAGADAWEGSDTCYERICCWMLSSPGLVSQKSFDPKDRCYSAYEIPSLAALGGPPGRGISGTLISGTSYNIHLADIKKWCETNPTVTENLRKKWFRRSSQALGLARPVEESTNIVDALARLRKLRQRLPSSWIIPAGLYALDLDLLVDGSAVVKAQALLQRN